MVTNRAEVGGWNNLEQFLQTGNVLMTSDLDIKSLPGYHCQVVTAPGLYLVHTMGFGYQKDWPYTDLFNYHLGQMIQFGIVDRIILRHIPHVKGVSDENCQQVDDQYPTSGYNQVTLPFTLVGVGIIVSVVILGGEVLLRRWRTKKCLDGDSISKYEYAE